MAPTSALQLNQSQRTGGPLGRAAWRAATQSPLCCLRYSVGLALRAGYSSNAVVQQPGSIGQTSICNVQLGSPRSARL